MSDTVLFHVDNEVVESQSKANNNTAQEVNNLCDFLKLEFEKYTEQKILYDTVRECMRSKSCTDSLRTKIKNKLIGESCLQCTDIDYNGKGTHRSLLGVQENSDELNFTETVELKNIVIGSLKLKYKEICDEFSRLTGSNIEEALSHVKDTSLIELTSDDEILLRYKQELILEQNQYMKNLLLQMDVLKEIAKLRLDTLPDITEHKIQECKIKSQMHVLRSQIIQQKVRVDVFTETNKSLDAYKQLIRDIREQQEECVKEIESLSDLKQKYQAVSCKQYDDILQSFIQYKSSIEKKRLLYECLNS